MVPDCLAALHHAPDSAETNMVYIDHDLVESGL